MSVNTLVIPDADAQQIKAVNSTKTGGWVVDVPTSQKLAAVLFQFEPDTTPAHYAGIRDAILQLPSMLDNLPPGEHPLDDPDIAAARFALLRITSLRLLVDAQTEASIPDGTRLDVVCEMGQKIVYTS